MYQHGTSAWDDRDIELELRDRMASLVAEIVSGSEGAIPEQFDYDMADHLRLEIERGL